MTCRYITLTNLIADRELMPEFVSCGNPDRDIRQMAERLTAWATMPGVFEERQKQLTDLAETAAVTGAVSRTADHLVKEIVTANHAEDSRAA